MSDSDSFINEVSEEVRRDKLYGYLRRYGWIAVALVLLLVGGAAWNEYRKAQATAAAEATGDALLAALSQDDPAARAEALAGMATGEAGSAVASLITAASQQEAGDIDAAAATLSAMASDGNLPEIYRDLAAFKGAMLDTGDQATRRQVMETLAKPGASFALLAQEQLALMDLAAGDQDAAIARLTAILEDAGLTRGLRDRAQRLMLALGADLPETVPSN